LPRRPRLPPPPTLLHTPLAPPGHAQHRPLPRLRRHHPAPHRPAPLFPLHPPAPPHHRFHRFAKLDGPPTDSVPIGTNNCRRAARHAATRQKPAAAPEVGRTRPVRVCQIQATTSSRWSSPT